MYDVIVVGRLWKVDLEKNSDIMFCLGLCFWGIGRSLFHRIFIFVSESKMLFLW